MDHMLLSLFFNLYMVIFNISYLTILFMTIVSLKNIKLIIFRSLGSSYILVLLFLATAIHLLNLAAIIQCSPANAVINETSGEVAFDLSYYDTVSSFLAGVRMCLIAMMFSTLIGRQFMLCKIFRTIKIPCVTENLSSRIQTLWSPLIISSLLWIPMIILFFMYDYGIIPVISFVICFVLYYCAYIAVFGYLAYRNRQINRIYSDYNLNVIVGILSVLAVITGMVITLIYQFIIVDDYMFEFLISFSFGFGFSISPTIILAKPCFIFFFRKHQINDWNDFNNNNGFLYGQNSSEIGKMKSLGENNMSSSVSDSPSQLLASTNIVISLTTNDSINV